MPKFQKGVSGNAAGRPKGARAKLGEAFLAALQADFETNGEAVIARIRADKPEIYLTVIAKAFPLALDLSHEEPVKHIMEFSWTPPKTPPKTPGDPA
jgi:hypothetical protein